MEWVNPSLSDCCYLHHTIRQPKRSQLLWMKSIHHCFETEEMIKYSMVLTQTGLFSQNVHLFGMSSKFLLPWWWESPIRVQHCVCFNKCPFLSSTERIISVHIISWVQSFTVYFCSLLSGNTGLTLWLDCFTKECEGSYFGVASNEEVVLVQFGTSPKWIEQLQLMLVHLVWLYLFFRIEDKMSPGAVYILFISGSGPQAE